MERTMPEYESGSGSATARPKPGTDRSTHAIDCPQNTRPAPILQALSAADLARRRRLVAKLHMLGPAPLAHFVAEVEAGADINATLEQYALLRADFVRPYGGDRFPELFAINGEAAP
jgi:hypothetical protein